MNVKARSARFIALVMLLSDRGTARAEPVSRDKPAVYQNELEKLLTPAKQVLAKSGRKAGAAGGEPAITLLYETLRRVDDQGRSCLVIHEIDQALTEGAGESMSASFWYQKSRQKAFLVLARSIQPDGSERPVDREAAFVQSPQPEASQGIFSDVAQIVVLFPHLKPQTVTESIVVIEDTEARIPGEYSNVLTFDARWPTERFRHVLEVDEKLTARLTLAPVGQAVPEPKREKVGGRTRLTWERDDVPKLTQEVQRAPSDQVGPAIWITTLADWNSLGRWYGDLLRGRDELSFALAAQVDDWTKGKKSPSELVSTLFNKVARDVRYVGLEFGIGGYRPHAPDEVWSNRYGDCKDKANLLHAMLRRKGIPSFLALVNTDHAGRVERRAPTQLHFNHVIVAVPEPDGKLLYCDPTLAYGRPGLLRPDDADRDVLLLKDNQAEFTHTPAQNAGSVRFDFDLAMEGSGRLSGWLTLEATDFYSAAYQGEFAGQNREAQRKRAHSMIQDFFRGAELIDLDVPAPDKRSGAFQLRVYFVVPGVEQEGGGQHSLRFPFAGGLRPDLGERRERETPLWQSQSTRSTHMRVRLPAGLAATALPRPFALDAAPVHIEARWEAHEGVVETNFVYRTPLSVVSRDEYTLLWNALHSLDAWIDKPVTVAPAAGAPPLSAGSAPPAPGLSDFPLMPSGEGQVQLAEQRYPLSEPTLRREALLKVLQWFPSDPATAFRVKVRLAEIDLEANPHDKAVLESVRRLLKTARGDVEKERYAWSEYVFALWLSKDGQNDEAIGIFTRQTNDKGLSSYRRAWSSVSAALLLHDKAPAAAERLLLDTLEFDEPESVVERYRLLADVLARQGKGDDLSRILARMMERQGERAPTVLAGLVAQARDLLDRGKRTPAIALIEGLRRVIAGKPGVAAVEAGIKELSERIGAAAVEQQIAESLKAYLTAHPPAWWATPLGDKLETREALERAVEELGRSGTPERYLRHALELLTRQPPGPDFPKLLWSAATAAEPRSADEGLFETMIGLCGKLPSREYRDEAAITSAKHHERKGEHAAAIASYERLAKDDKSPVPIKLAAWRLSGEVEEARRDYPRALAFYKKLEPERDASPRAENGLLRSAYINLELGRFDEALRIIGLLKLPSGDALGMIESRSQMKELIELAETKQALPFWRRQERWWRAWLDVEAAGGLTPVEGGVVVPIVPDLVDTGREIGVALRANDRKAMLEAVRRIAHAARWQPRVALELAQLVYPILPGLPDLAEKLHLLVIAELTDFESPDLELVKGARLQVAAHQFDVGHGADAFETTTRYLKNFGIDDGFGRGMVRIRAMSALREKQELDSVREQLSTVLAGSIEKRADTAILLAQVLQQENRVDEARALLKKELEHPDVKGDDKGVKTLRQFLDGLVDKSAVETKFSAAVKRWRRAHQPSWFDFAEPHRIDAKKYPDLDEALRSPPRETPIVERIKLALLIAEEDGQPYPRRVEALEAALKMMTHGALRLAEVTDLYRSAIADPGFEEALRAKWLWWQITDMSDEGRSIDKLVADPLAKGYNEKGRALLERCVAFAAVDKRNGAALLAHGDKLLGARLDPLATWQLGQVVHFLTELGDLDAAQALYAKTEGAEVDDNGHDAKGEVRLDLLKTINHARRTAPSRSELRRRILEALPGRPERPPLVADLHYPLFLDYLNRKTELAILLYMLDSREGVPDHPHVWAHIASEVERQFGRKGLGIGVYSTLLRDAEDDGARADLVALGKMVTDEDDPAQREALLAALLPYRAPDKNPETLVAIHALELRIALRLADAPSFSNLAALLESHGGKWERYTLGSRIERGLSTGDAAAVKNALEKMPPEALLDAAQSYWILPALELAGMKDEAQLVRESDRAALYKAILRSWYEPSGDNVGQVLWLARVLKAEETVPRAWISDLQRVVENVRLKNAIALFDARRNNDWPRALTAAQAILDDAPGIHRNHLQKAEALLRLGRKKEAVASLEIFLRYCKDDIEYPQAERMLALAKGQTPR